VFKAKNKQTKQTVALKKVLMENEKEGVSLTVAPNPVTGVLHEREKCQSFD
jgi:hypothetical protein